MLCSGGIFMRTEKKMRRKKREKEGERELSCVYNLDSKRSDGRVHKKSQC